MCILCDCLLGERLAIGTHSIIYVVDDNLVAKVYNPEYLLTWKNESKVLEFLKGKEAPAPRYHESKKCSHCGSFYIVMSRFMGVEVAEMKEIPLKMIGDALNVLHKQGVTHGDIHPRNILYDGNVVCFVDFEQGQCIDLKEEQNSRKKQQNNISFWQSARQDRMHLRNL